MKIKAMTDVGLVRKINEDSFTTVEAEKYCYGIVAAGMGGHLAGEVASAMAVHIIREYISEHMSNELDRFQIKELLCRAFRYANDRIYEYSCENESVMGMGTTATLCMIKDGELLYAHVGDSRAYAIGKDTITQLTRDHSYVQELVKLGMITPEQAKRHPNRNQITRAMGVEPDVRVDSGVSKYKGETILLSSDGLFGEIEDEEIKDIINQYGADATEKLVKLALDRGGRDNITAIILENGSQISVKGEVENDQC